MHYSGKPTACSVAAVLLVLLLSTVYLSSSSSSEKGISRTFKTKEPQGATVKPRDAAANRTLGFQKILALSTGPSWRTRGLVAAAEHTGLDIDILPHVPVAKEVAEAFAKIGEDDPSAANHPPLGAAQAWLSHLDLLKHIILNGYDTTLVIEDDVDWDVKLRTHQISLISDAVREFTSVPDNDTSPYGRNWDILWLGHCGEHTDPDTPRVEFADPTTPRHDDYTGWSKKYFGNFGEGHRMVQYAINPVCTFAYAVTAEGARNVLEWAGSGGRNEAYDIRLMEACRPRHLKVVSVQPEIMHHYMPPHEAGYWSEVNAADGKGTPTAESEWEGVMGGTENIVESARCRVLFGSTCVRAEREQW